MEGRRARARGETRNVDDTFTFRKFWGNAWIGIYADCGLRSVHGKLRCTVLLKNVSVEGVDYFNATYYTPMRAGHSERLHTNSSAHECCSFWHALPPTM